MTIFVGLGKQGALVWQRDPRPQLGLPIPQRGTIGLGLCQVVLQPLLVAQFMRLAKILSFERQRRCVTDLYCENSILRCPVPVTTNRRLRSSAVLSMAVVKPIQKMINHAG
jgi:hypothetical protein